MRRITLTLVSTIAVLTLLLGMKTHELDPVRRPGTVEEPVASVGITPGVEPTQRPSASADPSATATPTDGSSATTTPSSGGTPAHPTAHATTSDPGTRPTSGATTRPTKKPTPTATPTPSDSPHTFTGRVVGTIYGNVQIRITVGDGQITGVTILQVPDQDDVDRDVNDYAVPKLIQQTLARQSAQLDVVSGATYTSNAYMDSLQSAIDLAGL